MMCIVHIYIACYHEVTIIAIQICIVHINIERFRWRQLELYRRDRNVQTIANNHVLGYRNHTYIYISIEAAYEHEPSTT